MPRHPNSTRHPATVLVFPVLLAQGVLAIQWSSPQNSDVISPGDMILAAWETEKKIDVPILRLCSQGVGDREADCSVLGDSEFSHRKNGGLASLLLVPESVGPGESYFQVELAGEVHDSPHFSVLKSVQQASDVLSPHPPATGTAQVLDASTPLTEFVTQTIVMSIPTSSQGIHIPTLPANLPSLESLSWEPRLPAKPVVRLDSHGPNAVSLAVVIMVVLFALAAVGTLVAILRRQCKNSRQLNAGSPYRREPKADDRLTRLPNKKTVQYLPNLHSLGIHTVSEGPYSNRANRRISLEDVRLTPRIPFPSPKSIGGYDKGALNMASRGEWVWRI